MVRLKVRRLAEWQKAILFQFLMVRLKEEQESEPVKPIQFQFLMVRLKAKVPISYSRTEYHFNSLWFD